MEQIEGIFGFELLLAENRLYFENMLLLLDCRFMHDMGTLKIIVALCQLGKFVLRSLQVH